MKKLLAIVSLLYLASCSPQIYTIGMSQQDFVKKNPNARAIEMSLERTVYRKDIAQLGQPSIVKFFYFVDGKLVLMDEGTRSPDLVIKNTN